jgi:hypothetical protein
MYSNPHTHLAIARARQEDMIRQADRDRLARSFEDERPGAFDRLRARLAARRQPHSRPVTAH